MSSSPSISKILLPSTSSVPTSISSGLIQLSSILCSWSTITKPCYLPKYFFYFVSAHIDLTFYSDRQGSCPTHIPTKINRSSLCMWLWFFIYTLVSISNWSAFFSSQMFIILAFIFEGQLSQSSITYLYSIAHFFTCKSESVSAQLQYMQMISNHL